MAQTLRARGLDERRQEEVCGGDEEGEEGEVGPPLGAVAGRDHEEVVGQVEEEGGEVAEGADHVPLVPLPRDQPVVLHHLVDRGPRLNPGVQFNSKLITNSLVVELSPYLVCFTKMTIWVQSSMPKQGMLKQR